jgi:hypothetical protein
MSTILVNDNDYKQRLIFLLLKMFMKLRTMDLLEGECAQDILGWLTAQSVYGAFKYDLFKPSGLCSVTKGKQPIFEVRAATGQTATSQYGDYGNNN